jgi:hypothetical protein
MGMKYALVLDGATTMTVTTQACGQAAADISAITAVQISRKLVANISRVRAKFAF